jgi:hypothetical protein
MSGYISVQTTNHPQLSDLEIVVTRERVADNTGAGLLQHRN